MKEAFVVLIYMIMSDGTIVDRTYPQPFFFLSKEECERFVNGKNAWDVSADLKIIEKTLKSGENKLKPIPRQIWGCGPARVIGDNNVSR